MVVFELRDLQYDWWKLWTNWQLWLAGQVEGLVVSFAVSIFIGVFLGLSFGLIAWHFSQLSKGPLFGLFVCLFVWLYMLLYSVLFCIILVGLLKALFDGLFKRNPVIETKEIMSSSGINVIQIIKKNLPVVLLVGLIVALYYVEYGFFVIFALTIWMFRDMKTLDNSTHFIQIATPFHRFNSSMKNFYYSILQHKFLCYQLRKKGLLPLNLVTFLNDMSLRHILEFDGDPKTGTGGGSWRFRHRILQEYFAEKWVEPEDGGKK